MMFQDIRYALRLLASRPAFTAVAVLSLGIGIGANTAIFSLADALLLRPLPVERPEEVLRVVTSSPSSPDDYLSYRDYLDVRDKTKAFAGLAGYQQGLLGLAQHTGEPARVKLSQLVTPNYFDVAGVKLAFGRGFRADEEREPVAVLSHRLWATEFQADRGVIGRTVKISNIDFTIVGVAPADYLGLERFLQPEMYVPVGMRPQLAHDAKVLENRAARSVRVFGRLAPGRTGAEARAELKLLGSALEQAYPDTNRGRTFLSLTERQSRERQDSDGTMVVNLLFVIAGLVLLIACANVANLLLSRARGRAREISIRVAVGASGSRLVRQLLLESLVLSLAGGAAGVLFADLGVQFLSSIRFPSDIPIALAARLDSRALLFSLTVAVASSFLFGLFPSLQTLKADVAGSLKAGDSMASGKRRRFHMRDVLAAGQIGVSMVLLILSGLLVKDFAHTMRRNPGFRVDHLLIVSLDPATVGYDEARGRAFYRQLIERTQSLAGVKSVALAMHVPMGFTTTSSNIAVEGYQPAKGQESIAVQSNTVSAGYFDTMKIPVLSGRAFDSRDTADSTRVAVVNQAMAERYWPNRSAIGGRIKLDNRLLEVIGIAKTAQTREVGEAPSPHLYLPFAQLYQTTMTLHVETAGDPVAMAAPVLAEIRRIDPVQPVRDMRTLQNFFEEGAMFGPRLITQLVTSIGVLGMILALIGIYGVIAYSVSRRTRELGIRMALGAGRSAVLRLVLRQGIWLTAIGIGGGLSIALLASRVLRKVLNETNPVDPLVFAIVPVILGAASLFACYFPAQRAAKVDPLVALRTE